jgi:acyl-ACP thioesterase
MAMGLSSTNRRYNVKRFTAAINDGGYISVEATWMELDEDNNAIRVWNEGDLVAYIDTSVIMSAHISERKDING